MRVSLSRLKKLDPEVALYCDRKRDLESCNQRLIKIFDQAKYLSFIRKTQEPWKDLAAYPCMQSRHHTLKFSEMLLLREALLLDIIKQIANGAVSPWSTRCLQGHLLQSTM